MSDFEKVIKGLEYCISDEESECREECPYYDGCWSTDFALGYILKKDALKLLKEQTWRKFNFREPDADEKESHPEWVKVLIGGPDDGDEILVSNGKYVWKDEFYVDDTCHLDSDADLEECWWMPLPELPKEDENAD